MLSPDEFYVNDPPSQLQQGDICAGVPILLLPATEELILIRSPHRNLQLEHLDPGEVQLVREQAVSDAFDTTHEYVAAAAEAMWAMLMTPSCDLEGLEVWAVWPMHAIEGSGLEKAVANPNHPTLYRLPDHQHFPPSFIDLTDFRSVRKEHFRLKDRVASVSREAQHELTERFLKAASRPWGFGPGETVEPRTKYETGKYKCARCNTYDVEQVSTIEIGVGDRFPVCDNCKSINKSAQWYPLTKHKKS
ncbi:MAG: hypothetical protein ACJ71Q_07840 [Terriglobales bacterium]